MTIDLWTVQSVGFLRDLFGQGRVIADEKTVQEAVSFDTSRWTFMDSYQWMTQQMQTRMPRCPGASLPIWAMYRAGKSTRADRYATYGWDARPLAVIEFEIDESLVLLSDFDAWHCVLNFFPLAGRKEERLLDKELEKQTGSSLSCFDVATGELRQKVMKTWERIFDLGWCCKTFWRGNFRKQHIQATFWELKAEWVKSVKIVRDRA